MREYAIRDSQEDFLFGNTGCAEVGPNWEEVLRDLTGSFGLEEVGFLKAAHISINELKFFRQCSITHRNANVLAFVMLHCVMLQKE